MKALAVLTLASILKGASINDDPVLFRSSGLRNDVPGLDFRSSARPTAFNQPSARRGTTLASPSSTSRPSGGSSNGSRRHDNGKPVNYTKEPEEDQDPLNEGWKYFRFGPTGEPSNPTFRVNSPDAHVHLKITDLYRNGDRFAVYAVEEPYERLLLETDHVDADGPHVRCTDANKTFKSQIWSSGEVILRPGKYRIMIRPRSSPFNGGTAAIRFDTIDAVSLGLPTAFIEDVLGAPLCPGFGGFVIVRTLADSYMAADVCYLLQMEPARILQTDPDRKAAELTHDECMKRREPVWIHRYWNKANHGLAFSMEGPDQEEVREDPNLWHRVTYKVTLDDPRTYRQVMCKLRTRKV